MERPEENIGTQKDLCLYRIQTAKENLKSARILLASEEYKGANNRAYYAIFHAINAVHALDENTFKRHKDVIGYFNKNYVNTEVFPKDIGKRIVKSSKVREDSDYDDEYSVDSEKTMIQIETAKELIELVEKYLNDKK